MTHTLFISDLHLCEMQPHVNELFFDFMERLVPKADALYILGDLFEYWIGDDDAAEGLNARVKEALGSAVSGGTAVYFMHGNRDFLVGDDFARDTGVMLLPDPCPVLLHGTPALLMHGDTLCTDDVEYQKFRALVRGREWRHAFLAKPLTERRREVAELRARSEVAKRDKPAAIMDVTPSAVDAVLRAHGYPLLIHGHTHRPAHHVHALDGRRCDRWVLKDWHDTGGYVRASAGRVDAFEFP